MLASLPSQGAGQLTAQPENNHRIQSRATTPHKNLPSPKDVLEEGSGLKERTKAKETPLKPPTLCRYRDVACLEEQRKNGGKISANAPSSAQPQASQVAATVPKAEGNWFKRLGQKIAGAFSGASALGHTPPAGHSFLPATTAAAPPAPPPPPSFSTLNEAKLDPHNRIGTGGEDLFSGNYHWSTPLVSLPGRGGLDLNLSLHYNSLQWVRYSNTMYYEPDWRITYPVGLANGFNLGFPEIESGYSYDGATAWTVTLPSGYRVPLRRLGTSTRYQAADGSNLYLTNTTSTPILYTPDGTQYTYGTTSVQAQGGRRCTQVRDSNGNRLDITYNSGTGLLNTITDTLGRVLTFNYTGYQLLTITQNWFGQPKVLAQFDYNSLPLSYNFSGLTINGPASGSSISVLTRVITSDGARHVFVYNGWGIVDDIFLYGALDNQRAALDYAFPSSSAALTDSPRFTQRNDAIWGWSGQWYDPASGMGWAANYFYLDPNETYGQVTTPDGIVHKELFSASGNTRGLSTGLETIVSGVKRKWTSTAWLSDGQNRPLYPRVSETNIYDDADGNGTADNRRKVTREYGLFSQGGTTMPYTVYLPTGVNEYNADAATVYRRSETDYLNDSNYWTRWMVGLPSERRLLEGTSALQAKTSYLYDYTQLFTHPSAIVQHDTGTFHSGFYWRGNLTMVRRHNVSGGGYTETQADYNVTGTLAKSRDALNHETKWFYDDAFASYTDNGNNTETETVFNLPTKAWAYPTQVQDPDNFSSYMKYWYDTGAPTRTTDPKGAAAVSLYEATYGRMTKSKNVVTGAYTRYVYDPGHNWVQTWTTVNDATETAVLSLLDGASRERQRVDEHPGSLGTLSSWYRVYDVMGRVIEQSNPTEINGQANCGQQGQPSCWAPTGDDTTYVYTRQDYDWNHRPTVTYNQDYNASTNPNSKRTISYTGCGCAGGLVTTVTDEMGRQQKAYTDFLGRTFKTEIMNGAAVYSSAITTFNVRDQVTQVQELANASGVSQYSYFTYDGYGRLATSKKPIETAANSYQYNADDTLYSMTDARQAVTTYGYNARHLVTSMSYTVGSSGATATSSVTFQYNELGQRTVMNDGPGIVNYEYDQLGRMTSETRTFDLAGAPTTPFRITYGAYNLIGQVKKIKDPFNDEVNYSYDKTGRLANIIGATTFAGIANYPYLSTVSYRAWGGLKDARTYDARMRVTSVNGYFAVNYQYDLSSKLTYAEQLGNEPYHQSFTYDHAGRLTGATTPEINAPSQYILTQSNPPNGLPPGFKIRPFNATFSYDEFGNLTGRDNHYWHDSTVSTQPHQTFQTTYENGRAKKDNVAGRVTTNDVNQTWTYNAAGEITHDTTTSQQYDVVGRLTKTQDANNANIFSTHTFDGDGRQVKFYQQKPDGTTETRYRVYSSVTGKLLTEIDATGQKLETHIYSPNGQHRQMKSWTVYYSGGGSTTYPDTVVGEFSDPHGTRSRQWERQTNTYRDTHIAPIGVPMEAINWQVLKDRFVNGIAAQISYGQAQAVYYPYMRDIVEDPTLPGRGCMLDGQKVSCAKVAQYARQGAIGRINVSAPTGVIHGDGWTIGRTTDPDADNLNQGYLINLEKLRIDVGDSGEQQTTKPSCITPMTIINSEALQLYYSHAWYKTVKSAKDESDRLEHGGFVFYNRKDDTIFIYEAKPGKIILPKTKYGPKYQVMDEIFDELRALYSAFEKAGWDIALITAFHTHPNGNPIPSGFNGDLESINSFGSIAESYTRFGLIITGVDQRGVPQITPFDGNGVIKPDNKILNDCVDLSKRTYKIQ